MADNNICATLVVEEVEYEKPYYEMFLAQKRLQLRLNSINTDYSLDVSIAAKRCIYWHFCINAELKELLDWFKNHDGTIEYMSLLKEAKMEAIDVLHFVFNIALELGFNEDHANTFMELVPETTHVFDIADLTIRSNEVLNKSVELIEQLSWKTWKMYPDLAISELALVVEDEVKKLIMANFRLCYGLGMSKQEIVNYYFAKNRENHRRQDNGY